MSMTQNFLALDLEMNKPSGKIIEVGVCIGAYNQPDTDYVKRSWYLDPEEPIDAFITGLTGITDQTIATSAVPWATMAGELSALIGEHQPFLNPVTWGGGDTQLLLQSISEQGITFPHFGRRWIDAKTIYVFNRMAESKPTKGGLRSAMAAYMRRFQGTPHRAGDDAYNTLRLFFAMLGRQRTQNNAAQLFRESLE